MFANHNRMRQRQMDRDPGTPGAIIVLQDQSSSVPCHPGASIELEMIRKTNPIRIFVFANLCGEVMPGETVCVRDDLVYPPVGIADKIFAAMGVRFNASYMGAALQKIAPLRPAKTIVLSDGMAADQRLALQVADQMTGEIDTYCCSPNPELYRHSIAGHILYNGGTEEAAYRTLAKQVDQAFMAELARVGGGTYREYSSEYELNDLLRENIRIACARRFHHGRLPDQHFYLGRRG